MAKKQYFLIFGSKAAVDGAVADFGAIVVDRKGKIYEVYPTSVTGYSGVKIMSAQAMSLFGIKAPPTFGVMAPLETVISGTQTGVKSA